MENIDEIRCMKKKEDGEYRGSCGDQRGHQKRFRKKLN